MKESRIGSEKLPSKLDEHLINKVEGATSLTSSATPDRIRFNTELKGYGSVSESGKHVQPAGGDL